MKNAVLILFLVVILSFVQACTTKPRELKSPCVGSEGSPCDKRPANPYIVGNYNT